MSGERRLEYSFARTRPEDLDLAHQRRLVLIIAMVALGVLVFWMAVDPFPSSFNSFYGPP